MKNKQINKNVCTVFIENICLLICLFFIILLLFTVYCMRFLNKNSNKIKKIYFIQKIEITPKRLDGVDFRHFRKCRHFENILFELGAVDDTRLPIFVLIRFWEI
jgi:hypothetical protein